MERNTGKLPESWNTDDENPARAAKTLHRILGAEAAFILHRRVWLVVRFLDPKDKFRRNAVGQLRELYPWQRSLEILATGRHFGECLWQLKNGGVRAMVGKGVRPIHDPQTREWTGFINPDGSTIGDQVVIPGLVTP